MYLRLEVVELCVQFVRVFEQFFLILVHIICISHSLIWASSNLPHVFPTTPQKATKVCIKVLSPFGG
jgi:hypothetical protein